jgi:hypothetical protein
MAVGGINGVTGQDKQSNGASWEADEERWFSDRDRSQKRPFRSSPTTPPPPIGDALADGWFR